MTLLHRLALLPCARLEREGFPCFSDAEWCDYALLPAFCLGCGARAVVVLEQGILKRAQQQERD